MSFAYLPEHAENALFALELAEREAAHLAYTHSTLFAKKIDAFVGRFGRLQDHIGEKLIPRFA